MWSKKKDPVPSYVSEQNRHPRARVTVTPVPLLVAAHAENTDHVSQSQHLGETPTYIMEFDIGTQITVTGPGVVGRDPATDQGYVHVIRITDADKMISRNHFAFGLTVAGQLWISDLNSANGTYIKDTQVLAGLKTAISPGTLIRFGSHTAKVMIHTQQSSRI